jgi:serine/threonine-protein kinase
MPDLPGRAVAAVDKALSKAPKDRYPDVASFIAELTGTALQTLSGLGPDPDPPLPIRGAARDASVHDESATDATFVPARSAAAGAMPASAPQAPAAAPEPSVERGSTLAAFRFAEQQAAERPPAPSMTGSRRSTDLETPAAAAPAPQPRMAPVPASPPAGRSKTPLILAAIGGVLLLGGGIAVGGKLLTPSDPPVPGPPPPATVTQAPPPAVTPPVAEDPPIPPATPPANPTVDPKPVTVSSPRPGKPETMPEAVRQELEEAERALDESDYNRAIRLAQRTLATKRTEAAFFLIGRAYCHLHDLSNAKAQLRNLSSQGKSKLRTYCAKHEVSL